MEQLLNQTQLTLTLLFSRISTTALRHKAKVIFQAVSRADHKFSTVNAPTATTWHEETISIHKGRLFQFTKLAFVDIRHIFLLFMMKADIAKLENMLLRHQNAWVGKAVATVKRQQRKMQNREIKQEAQLWLEKADSTAYVRSPASDFQSWREGGLSEMAQFHARYVNGPLS